MAIDTSLRHIKSVLHNEYILEIQNKSWNLLQTVKTAFRMRKRIKLFLGLFSFLQVHKIFTRFSGFAMRLICTFHTMPCSSPRQISVFFLNIMMIRLKQMNVATSDIDPLQLHHLITLRHFYICWKWGLRVLKRATTTVFPSCFCHCSNHFYFFKPC